MRVDCCFPGSREIGNHCARIFDTLGFNKQQRYEQLHSECRVSQDGRHHTVHTRTFLKSHEQTLRLINQNNSEAYSYSKKYPSTLYVSNVFYILNRPQSENPQF